MTDRDNTEIRRAVDDLVAAYSQPITHKVIDIRTREPVYARHSLLAALANIDAVRKLNNG
jgi:hypothetical protein